MRDRRPEDGLLVLLIIAVSFGLVASGVVRANDGGDGNDGARATYVGDDIDALALYVEDFGDAYDGPHDGVIGNLGPPAYPELAQPGMGGAHLAVPVYPRRADLRCSEGFRVRVVHLLARANPASGVGVRVELIESIRMTGCPVPPEDEFDVIVHDEVHGLGVEQSGWYDVSVPFDDSPCAYPQYRYFIGFWPYTLERVVVDAEVSTCPAWLNIGFGLGWMDPGYRGDVIVFAEVDCCFQPVRGDESSWGSVKALFDAESAQDDRGP